VSILLLSSCLSEPQNRIEDNVITLEEYLGGYANRMQVASTTAQMMLLSQPFWVEGGVPESGDLGGDPYAKNGVTLQNGYCVNDMDVRDKITILTWMENEAEKASLLMPGIGEVSYAEILRQMKRSKVNKNATNVNFGIMQRDGDIYNLVNDDKIVASFPVSCSLDVPMNSVVYAIEIDLPESEQFVNSRKELTTRSCASDEDGHILVEREIIITAGGNEVEGRERVLNSFCQKKIEGGEIVVYDSTTTDFEITGAGVDGEFAARLGAGLSGQNCRIARVKEKVRRNPDSARGVQTIGHEEEVIEAEIYNTCDSVGEVELNEGYIGAVPETQTAAYSCSGISPAGSGNATLLGLDGVYAWTTWYGTATMMRTPIDVNPDSSIVWTSWWGDEINCNRQETFEVTCDEAYPGNSSYTKTIDDGLTFQRLNNINDWTDYAALVPGSPSNPAWGNSPSSNCQWRETSRSLEVCPPGHVGQRVFYRERFFNATSHLNGAWSGWTTTSVDDQCVLDTPEARTFSCNSIGGAGTATITYNGDSATHTFAAWTGTGRETREPTGVDMDTGNTIWGPWRGDGLNCIRDEMAVVSCNSAHSGMGGFTNTRNDGYRYDRTNAINGFANVATSTPNAPSNPAWSYRPGLSGCAWEDERTRTVSCESGFVGDMTITERRTYSSTNQTGGSWSAWNEISRDVTGCTAVGSDTRSVSCATLGGSGAGTASINGVSGAVTYPAYSGTITHSRTLDIVNPGDHGRGWGPWRGDTLSCSRTENLNISCANAYSSMGAHTLVQNNGYDYTRSSSINGWADASTLTPNNPSIGSWTFNAATSGCRWREERTRTESCTSGAGNINIEEERIFTANALTGGSWSAWTETSRIENCVGEPSGLQVMGIRCIYFTKTIMAPDAHNRYRLCNVPNAQRYFGSVSAENAPDVLAAIDEDWIYHRQTADEVANGTCRVGTTIADLNYNMGYFGSTYSTASVEFGDAGRAELASELQDWYEIDISYERPAPTDIAGLMGGPEENWKDGKIMPAPPKEDNEPVGYSRARGIVNDSHQAQEHTLVVCRDPSVMAPDRFPNNTVQATEVDTWVEMAPIPISGFTGTGSFNIAESTLFGGPPSDTIQISINGSAWVNGHSSPSFAVQAGDIVRVRMRVIDRWSMGWYNDTIKTVQLDVGDYRVGATYHLIMPADAPRLELPF
jgi:hypothetical protein